MKNTIKYLFFILTSLLYAQEQTSNIEINWNSSTTMPWGKSVINAPHFQKENFKFNPEMGTICFSILCSRGTYVNEKSLSITNLITQEITIEQPSDIKIENLPTSPLFTIKNITSRDEVYSVLEFYPLFKLKDKVVKITNLSYSFKTNNAFKTQETKANISPVSSVLKTGNWKKFAIEKTGVYKIDKAFLNELGIDVKADPRTLKFYGYGGKMLPLLNKDNKYYDLPEIAVQFIGEEDGVFNDNDYVLLYAEGMDAWSEENQTHINLYADKTYYYVTTGIDKGKRIAPFTEPTEAATKTYSQYDYYSYHEIDTYNIGELGRKWYGEELHIKPTVTFDFSIPNLNLTAPVILKVNAATASNTNSLLNVSVNGIQKGVMAFGQATGSEKAYESTFTSLIDNLSTNNLSIGLTFQNQGNPSAKSYLNYIAITGKSLLKGTGKQYGFTINELQNQNIICEYQLDHLTAGSQIWDITDPTNILAVLKPISNSFTFKSNTAISKSFHLLETNDFYQPKIDQNKYVTNQDLKGTVLLKNNIITPLDYLIVCPSFLKQEAERLANLHRKLNNLHVKVIDLESIYNEFSGAKQDIVAIRNFIKYIYDASPQGQKLKYVCLFGDASFDYKNRIKNNTNIVPIFQSINSFSMSNSFATDEFYALMDPNEGNLIFGEASDIAVGRILANDTNQAAQMVDKILSYHSEKAKGKWKNELIFLSDDVDRYTDSTLQENLNNMADAILAKKPSFNAKKIFTDAYIQETTAGGQKYPKAKSEFINAFNSGALVVTYIGHGSELGFASERLFDIADVKALQNTNKLPLFITVTCDFSRFDNPLRETGGEVAFKNPTTGPIALITTTREVSQYLGEQFNLKIPSNLFNYDGKKNSSIAEAVRKTKIELLPLDSYVISFLGDPAMKLATPEPNIIITKINNIPTENFTEPLQALSKYKIEGIVTNNDNTVLNQYNGDLFITVYDKNIKKTTLANDGTKVNGQLFKMDFETVGETIFRGNTTVTNGSFEINFVVPKDIVLAQGNGKISLYTTNTNTLEERSGNTTNVKIGGINPNPPIDNTPPTLKIYLNNKNFVSGSIVSQKPLLIAEMKDENGINTAGGIGHDIIAFIDNDQSTPILLNDYYNTEKGDYTQGNIKFQLQELSPGPHKIIMKVWDTYNNMTTTELDFIVVDDADIVLSRVLNYPNPFVNYTEFWFNHNKPFEILDVQVQVMTITGKIVWTKNQELTTTGYNARELTWDGKDDFGEPLAKGVYLYKLTVKSKLSNKKAEKHEKLVIL